eukprot:gene13126-14475_t
MVRLRSSCKITENIKYLCDNNLPLKILFHNVRSLKHHFADISCDINVNAAHINLFVETALRNDNKKSYKLENFAQYRFDDEHSLRSTYGTVVYIRNTYISKCLTPPHNFNISGIEVTSLVLHHPSQNLRIVALYRSSRIHFQQLADALESICDNITSTNPSIIFAACTYCCNSNIIDVMAEEKTANTIEPLSQLLSLGTTVTLASDIDSIEDFMLEVQNTQITYNKNKKVVTQIFSADCCDTDSKLALMK